MDEAQRAAERRGEGVALARLLLRRGERARARRVLEDAARDGAPGALEQLDAAFPLEPAVAHLVRELTDPPASTRVMQRLERARWILRLIGHGDPRLRADVRRAVAQEPGFSPVLSGETLQGLERLLDLPLVPRLREALERTEDAEVLVWARPSEEEARELLVGPRPTNHSGLQRLWSLTGLWALGRDGHGAGQGAAGAEALRPYLGDDGWLERLEARRAMERLGRSLPGEVAESPELVESPRPEWVPSAAPPALLREGITGCFLRDPSLLAPGDGARWAGAGRSGEVVESDAARPVHGTASDGAGRTAEVPGRWVLALDVDRSGGRRGVRDPVSARAEVDGVLLDLAGELQRLVGDRVVWNRGEVLVVIEQGDGREVAEALRELVRDERGRTASAGVARSGDLYATLRRADEALRMAKRRGGDRVVVA